MAIHSPIPAAETVSATGTVTTPGAGAAIATISNVLLPAGDYEVEVLCGYGGTAGVVNNMDLRRGGVSIGTLYVAPVANGTPPRQLRRRVTLDGTQSLTVNAIAAAGAGQVFIASIRATRLHSG